MDESSRGEEADPEVMAQTELARGDDGRVIDVLMAAYGKQIYSYCRRMLWDEGLAEEVHQLTFLNAYQSCGKFDGRSSMKTWLFGIARHRCLDALKSQRRRDRRFATLEDAAEPPDPSTNAEDDVVMRELRRALRACVDELDARTRDAVVLRYMQGMSYPEIAQLWDERAPTLQARVARALPSLRRCLDAKGMRL